jgi:Glycosyltransferase family 87
MLTLGRVPQRLPAPRRIAWQSPVDIPWLGMTIAFAGCAVFAIAMALVTKFELHRLWAIFAACSYLLAAMAVVVWKARGVDLALIVSFVGALVIPLSLMAARQMEQPEVSVIDKSAAMLIHHGTPYLGPAALAAAHNPNIFDPYLPLMTAFGLPHALFGFSALTDPRIWFGLGFLGAFAGALAASGVKDVIRWTALITASPVIAFSLSVGGTDVPVLAFQCLGLALLWRRPRIVLAGMALGAAAAMKATAWPALMVAAVLLLVRDGRKQALTMSAAALAVIAAVVGPVLALWPGALVQNTIEFPLGLAHIKSQAVSPLPGRLLAETGHAGHMAAVALLVLAGAAVVASVLIRPPRTVSAATWRLIVGLSAMFLLAPATRFGYFVYPVGMLVWLGVSWLCPPEPVGEPPPGLASARSLNSDSQDAYQPANHGSAPASGTMNRTVWA